MKVLILSEFFYPDKSSTPKVLTELAEDLVAYGLEVEVITSKTSYKGENSNLKTREVYKDIVINRVNSTELNRNSYIGRIVNYITFLISTFIKVIIKKDYDCILMVSNPPVLPLIGYIVNKFKKKPYVYLLHDVYPDIAVKVGAIKENGLVFKVMEYINKKIFNSASKVIVLGKDMKKNLLDKKVDENKIEIITNWADKEKIYKENKKNDFSVQECISETFNIVYTGNIGRFHDVETILETANKLKDNSKISFIFVGDGYKKQNIENYKKENSLNNIKLMGYKYGETYNQLLNASDIFITTLDKGIEGLGVPSKTYSYMAAGKPIIAIMNSSSEIGSLVEEKELGIRINSGESDKIVEFISKISNDENLYSNIVKNVCDTFNTNYERKIVTKKFKEVIANILVEGESNYVQR